MSEFPGRPRTERGALLVYESQQPGTQPSQRILFQYNPEQLRRSFAARTPQSPPSSAGAAREEALRVPGPPVETINLSVVLDAADQVGNPTGGPGEDGLHPALARLELLLYPATSHVEEIERQAEQGRVQVSPGNVPLVMLAWGRARVVPVLVTSFSVTEEAFDPLLNPISAKVDLALKVLTYVEFPDRSAGRDAYVSYQKRKEQFAEASGPSSSPLTPASLVGR